MTAHAEITALEQIRDRLTDLHEALRFQKDRSPLLFEVWSHLGNAHTEVCMALDGPRLAAGVFRQAEDAP